MACRGPTPLQARCVVTTCLKPGPSLHLRQPFPDFPTVPCPGSSCGKAGPCLSGALCSALGREHHKQLINTNQRVF